MRMLVVGLSASLGLFLAGCGGTTPATTPTPTAAPTTLNSTGTTLNSAPTTLNSAPTPSITVPVLPSLHDRGLVEGGDVSWPQCPRGMGIPERPTLGSPMPLDSAEFVILGLTNGPAFTPNPCLDSQVAWAASRHLLTAAYAVVSFPTSDQLQQYGGAGPFPISTRLGQLANTGYAQAQFAVETMRAASLPSPTVWLDVEPVPGFDWSTRPAENAAVVRGAARALSEATFQVGVYSTTAMWRNIVGDLRLGVREWRPAGHTSRAEALRRCGPERMIQGGTAVLAQWVEDGRDRNVTCPGESAYLPLWFHQY